MLIGIHITDDEARAIAERIVPTEAWQTYRAITERTLVSEKHSLTPMLLGTPTLTLQAHEATQAGHFASALSALHAIEPNAQAANTLLKFLAWIEAQDSFIWGGGFVQGQFLKGAVLALDAVGATLPVARQQKIVERLIVGSTEDKNPDGPANKIPNGCQPMRRFLEIPGCGFHLKDEQVNNWDMLSSMGLLYVCRAADALLPDRAKDVDAWIEVARRRLERFYNMLYTEQGEYGEGPGYYSYGATGAVMTLDLLHRWTRTNASNAPRATRTAHFSEQLNQQESPRVPWTHSLPTKGLFASPRWSRQMHPREIEHGPFNVNDSFLGMPESPLVAHWIAARAHDPEAQVYGDEQFRLAQQRAAIAPQAESDFEPIVWSMIWRDPSLKPTTPQTSRAQSFGRFGTVICRTGHTSSDLCLFFRCGEPAGAHTHADRGNFLLTAFGENLVSEGGRPRDRGAVPEFMKFHHETWAHNCAMPTGQPQQREHDGRYVFGRITQFDQNESGASIVADLGDVYPGAGRVERRLRFSYSGWLLIEDFIERPGEAIDFLLHTDNRDRNAKITIEAERAVIRRPNASLLIFPLLPASIVDDGTHFQDADREGLRSLILRRPASSMATLLVAVRAGEERSVILERVAQHQWTLNVNDRAETISLTNQQEK